MSKFLPLFTTIFLTFGIIQNLSAHEHATLKGLVTDSVSGQAINGASILLNEGLWGTSTDAFGQFRFTKLTPGYYQISISSLGFSTKKATVFLSAGNVKTLQFSLSPGALLLAEVKVAQPAAAPDQAMHLLNKIDATLRPVNSGQDLLRLVPGLFIAQHAGGGKAEQIFLRGFDADHGTDFAVSVDGIPVNMVSHAHGQGYADFHFVIPETIEALEVYKGPYYARYGNFATAGAGAFTTKNKLRQSLVKMEAGRFNSYRGLAMIDLLENRHLFTEKLPENAYVAAEFMHADAYFESPQNFKRINIFGKYSGLLSDHTALSLSASTFRSSWDASGQIPERAVAQGIISRFGSIDNSEGGSTSRTNANLDLSTSLTNETTVHNQLYFSHYQFDLFSNFTFFLHDTLNGDQIRQTENGRNIYGYQGIIEKRYRLGTKNLQTTIGLGTRLDVGATALMKAVKRQVTDTLVAGKLREQNVFAFMENTLALTEKLSMTAGLRFDHFQFGFRHFTDDPLSGRAGKSRVSPKLNFIYTINPAVQLFARSGFGFHSNDARGVVAHETANVLPKALGYELGSTFKLTGNLLINAAIWHLDMENELVYVGDEGVVEINGPTRRLGTDLALRYQISKLFYADADLNINHGRFRQAPEGENYIPLAPVFTSTGGLTLKQDRGLNASLRYRCLNSRPANETNTVQAKGYLLLDAMANYTWPHLQIGISIENMLNSNWNEAQFDTESQLKNEPRAVSELHFTPGTPLFMKASLSYLF